MKKKILLLFLLSIMVWGVQAEEKAAPEDESRVYLGAGPYFQSQPYRGAAMLVLPSPVIFFDNELFYVRWTRVGMYFMGGDNWGFSLSAQPRPFGYSAKDAATLAGMADRHSSWEGGISFAAKNNLGFLELLYFQDLLDNSNGSLLRLEVGKKITTGKWTIVPSLLLIRFSQKFNNYYYGVRSNEATPQRPAYTADAGINYAAQSYLMYDITKNWHILGNLRLDLLSSTISNSPIVEDRVMFSGLLSVMYSFGYN